MYIVFLWLMFRWLFGRKEEKLDQKEIDELVKGCERADHERAMKYEVEKALEEKKPEYWELN